eukprot:scaffold104552_cov20-Tisochrysis_lutea.AAC.1
MSEARDKACQDMPRHLKGHEGNYMGIRAPGGAGAKAIKPANYQLLCAHLTDFRVPQAQWLMSCTVKEGEINGRNMNRKLKKRMVLAKVAFVE